MTEENSKLDELLAKRGKGLSDTAKKGKGPFNKEPKIAVMVVDDDKGMRRSLSSALSDYAVVTAQDGRESLDVFQKNPEIHCVVMDALMPKMDGFEASKHIHGMNPDIPIIMLTAYQDEHDISRVVDLGFEGYVTKGAIEITPEGEVVFPNLNDLKNKLKRACEKYRGIFRNKHFEHATDPRLIEDIVEFSMDIESRERVPEDHAIAGQEEATRYVTGTSYPENSDYILFSMELDNLFNLRNKHVLEICSGPGDLSYTISKYGPDRVVAIDGSEKMIAHSTEKHMNDNLEFRLGDIFELGELKGGFDLVVCQNSLHHFSGDTLAAFFNVAWGYLKPGGSLLLSDYRRESINDTILSQRLKGTNKHVREDLMHTILASYTKEELESALDNLKEKIEYDVFFPEEAFRYLKKTPEYREIVSNDPHPHYLDYELSLRVKMTRLQ